MESVNWILRLEYAWFYIRALEIRVKYQSALSRNSIMGVNMNDSCYDLNATLFKGKLYKYYVY